MKPEIVRRYAHNPILTKGEIPFGVETVHNVAVVKHNGEYIMLFRSHLRTGRSIIGLARSRDGFRFKPRTRSRFWFLRGRVHSQLTRSSAWNTHEDPPGRLIRHHVQRVFT